MRGPRVFCQGAAFCPALPLMTYKPLLHNRSGVVRRCFRAGKKAKKNQPAMVGFLYGRVGGDEGDRTPGLRIANAALSQLSYIPGVGRLIESPGFHVNRFGRENARIMPEGAGIRTSTGGRPGPAPPGGSCPRSGCGGEVRVYPLPAPERGRLRPRRARARSGSAGRKQLLRARWPD